LQEIAFEIWLPLARLQPGSRIGQDYEESNPGDIFRQDKKL
jgi:hypothetical protein